MAKKAADAAALNRVSPADLKRLETHLRRTLGCATLALDAPVQRSASVQLRVGDEVLGTVDQVDEDGERSWAVTLVILQEDLD